MYGLDDRFLRDFVAKRIKLNSLLPVFDHFAPASTSVLSKILTTAKFPN